jgi:GT2 family glycosyltransferase
VLELWPAVQFVQFIDGDCELDSRWLPTAMTFLEERQDVALVFGRRRERHPERSIFNGMCDREWSGKPGVATECGGDVLVRASVLRRLGGYRDDLIAGEEPELCIRIRSSGLSIWRLDAEMTRHDAAMTRLGQWWRRTMRAGHAYAEVSQLHRSSPFRIWRRNIRRTLFWSALLPVAAAASIVQPAAALVLLLYPLQVLRLALRQKGEDRWRHALFNVLGKFAEMQGVLRYHLRTLLRRRPQLVEYK